MLETLKRFSIALIIGVICNIGFFTQLGEFVSTTDKLIGLGIVLGYDIGLIAMMVNYYLKIK